MKVFGLIIALLLSISCRGGSIKVDYKSIIDKYQYVNEILEMTNQEVSDKDDKIYQYILSKEQGKKHIDTFFEEIKVKESKENQFLILSRLLLQINKVNNKYKVAQNFEKLINELLKSKSPKKWFRAYFNHGLINYIYGNKRLLPCDMSKNAFFIDPFCDVVPCNGMKEKAVMGNLREQDWNTLWNSDQAQKVRECTKHCDRNCWMIGSVSPAMHKYIWVPAWWVIKHKIFKGGKYSLEENKYIGDKQ